jgi:hypothetical protein
VTHIWRMNRNIATARKTRQRILRSFIRRSQAQTVLAVRRAFTTSRGDVSADAQPRWRSTGLSLTNDE